MSGFPTVLSQEAKLIFGPTALGHALFFAVQAGAISILFTGGNTSFSGFPFLTSFVAEDSFLPRWLSKRGHRLVFSDGIIMLTVLALTLLIGVGANTNNLVPFYAIGVFTGFAMAGFGMASYHTRHKEPGWRRRRVINFACGIYTALVVVIFAIVKFTEGAWLVVAVFPVLIFAFIRMNRQYGSEAAAVEALDSDQPADPPNYPRRAVLVLIDDLDLAAIATLRYARSLHPTTLRAVHFVLDQHRAEHLRQLWLRTDRSIPLDLVECQDRRLDRPRASSIVALTSRQRVTVDGRVHSIEIRQVGYSCILECTITDPSGEVTALFYGRGEIPGLIPGSHVRLRGTVSSDQTRTLLINPAYEFLG